MRAQINLFKFFRHLLRMVATMVMLITSSEAQTNTSAWLRILSGNDYDTPSSIVETSDGGFMAIGSAHEYERNAATNHGGCDAWLMKFNKSGIAEWEKTFGGTGDDKANFIFQLKNHQYLVAGNEYSCERNFKTNHGFADGWVIKLSRIGTMIWQKFFGGSEYDDFKVAMESPDGGYLFAGNTCSSDGDVKQNHGNSDYWIIKTDSNGNIVWSKTFGGSKCEMLFSAIPCTHGGYILAGKSKSNPNSSAGNASTYSVFIVKIDEAGKEIWNHLFEEWKADQVSSLNATSDGGCIVGVNTKANLKKSFIVKLGAEGNADWNTMINDSDENIFPAAVVENSDGYLILSNAFEKKGTVNPSSGKLRVRFLQLDAERNLVWEKTVDSLLAIATFCFVQPLQDGVTILTGGYEGNKSNKTINEFDDFILRKHNLPLMVSLQPGQTN